MEGTPRYDVPQFVGDTTHTHPHIATDMPQELCLPGETYLLPELIKQHFLDEPFPLPTILPFCLN